MRRSHTGGRFSGLHRLSLRALRSVQLSSTTDDDQHLRRANEQRAPFANCIAFDLYVCTFVAGSLVAIRPLIVTDCLVMDTSAAAQSISVFVLCASESEQLYSLAATDDDTTSTRDNHILSNERFDRYCSCEPNETAGSVTVTIPPMARTQNVFLS